MLHIQNRRHRAAGLVGLLAKPIARYAAFAAEIAQLTRDAGAAK